MQFPNPHRVLRFAVAAIAVIGVASCSSDPSSTVATDTTATSAETSPAPTVSVTTTAVPTTTPETAPVTAVASSDAVTTPTTNVIGVNVDGDKIMPDVVCENLQAAQDIIQTHGVFLSLSNDATGAGRNQLVDSNWIVVAQTPAPGTPFDEGDAVLSAVKLTEPNSC